MNLNPLWAFMVWIGPAGVQLIAWTIGVALIFLIARTRWPVYTLKEMPMLQIKVWALAIPFTDGWVFGFTKIIDNPNHKNEWETKE